VWFAQEVEEPDPWHFLGVRNPGLSLVGHIGGMRFVSDVGGPAEWLNNASESLNDVDANQVMSGTGCLRHGHR
jgi:hypothetical protein